MIQLLSGFIASKFFRCLATFECLAIRVRRTRWACGASTFAVLMALWLAGLSVLATELPPGLVQYIRQKDPQARIRFDGLILMSNGETYLPVFPAVYTPDGNSLPNSSYKVTLEEPTGVHFPDIVQFENASFLLRLIPTTSGKVTLPRRAQYPIELKAGLLPQDLLLPANLSVPAELKVILGAIPYQTPEAPKVPDWNQAPVSSAFTTPESERPEAIAFLADFSYQKLLALDPDTGREYWNLNLDCLPSSVQADPSGNQVFLTCMTTDELLVVDVRSNLIKTRIKVGARPGFLLSVPEKNTVFVSNRFSKDLTLVDTRQMTKIRDIALPGFGGPMAYNAVDNLLYVADTSKEKVYEVDVDTQRVVRIFKGGLDAAGIQWIAGPANPLEAAQPKQAAIAEPVEKAEKPNSGGLKLFSPPEKASKNPILREGSGQLWIASRTSGQVTVINLKDGLLLDTFTVGNKPSDMLVSADQKRLYLLSANASQVEVFDTLGRKQLEPIELQPGSFPSAMARSADDRFLYITNAAAEELYQVDVQEKRLLKTHHIQAKGMDISLFTKLPTTPSSAEKEKEPKHSHE
ncbi:MAG: YncE family protein [Candidatus Melainabacteria bacterium]|nr:YncE family protein [Candidatus Melainabacteria bacterium]